MQVQVLSRALEDKERYREYLRKLPLDDKLIIVAFMQRRANEIRRSVGRAERPEFPGEVFGGEEHCERELLRIQSAYKG